MSVEGPAEQRDICNMDIMDAYDMLRYMVFFFSEKFFCEDILFQQKDSVGGFFSSPWEDLELVATELNSFCEGNHPLFPGRDTCFESKPDTCWVYFVPLPIDAKRVFGGS